MHDLLNSLQNDFPAITFTPGEACFWSPRDRTVTYKYESMRPDVSAWSIIHEVSHADLGHRTYKTDFELVQLEVDAWQQAIQIAKRYNIAIDPEHIQDCLDTYRDWLHGRSTCPDCSTVSLQKTPTIYECFNCHCTWHVTASRFCRPYRRKTTVK